MKLKKSRSKTYIGNIHNLADRAKAIEVVASGGIAAVFNRGVNALWIDGSNLKAVQQLQKVKGEARIGRPVALTIPLEKLKDMLALEHISSEVRDFINLSSDLKSVLGSLCFIRAPIKDVYSSEVPASSLSKDGDGNFWLQTWDPHGHIPTEKLLAGIYKSGITYPAVTSMNYTGSPEIVDQQEAEAFCRDNSIQIYLKDGKAHPGVIGSYTIISLTNKGVELTREGNVPGRVLESLFRLQFIKDNTKPANHPQLDFPSQMFTGLNPQGIRMAVLLYLEGKEDKTINSTLIKRKDLREHV